MDDGKNQKIKEFTALFDVPGNTINEDNEIKELIAQKIGAYCQEQWLSGKSADEAIASYIASGEYTDFISGNTVLYEAGALIPIDVYWDDYPNIKIFCLRKYGTDSGRQMDMYIGFHSLELYMAKWRKCCMKARHFGYKHECLNGQDILIFVHWTNILLCLKRM